MSTVVEDGIRSSALLADLRKQRTMARRAESVGARTYCSPAGGGGLVRRVNLPQQVSQCRSRSHCSTRPPSKFLKGHDKCTCGNRWTRRR